VIEFPKPLLIFLHRTGFFYWDSLIAGWQGPVLIWKEARCMGMQGDIALQWDLIRTSLRNCGIFHSANHDSLLWRNSKGVNSVRVKDIYQNLSGLKQAPLSPSFPLIFWKSGCPSKTILF